MEFIARSARNPFDMTPPCDRYVPGYGATNADFHVVGDHPGVHGGLSTGIPFTGQPWSERFFDVLVRGGLVGEFDSSTGAVVSERTYFSYLYMCDAGDGPPDAEDYAKLEPFFDAELRAITAHVLLPVGRRATAHVLSEYTARATDDIDMAALHGFELRGSGWLVVPVKEPAEWTQEDDDRLVEGLRTLTETDYRQVSDLGRFFSDGEPYLVR